MLESTQLSIGRDLRATRYCALMDRFGIGRDPVTRDLRTAGFR